MGTGIVICSTCWSWTIHCAISVTATTRELGWSCCAVKEITLSIICGNHIICIVNRGQCIETVVNDCCLQAIWTGIWECLEPVRHVWRHWDLICVIGVKLSDTCTCNFHYSTIRATCQCNSCRVWTGLLGFVSNIKCTACCAEWCFVDSEVSVIAIRDCDIGCERCCCYSDSFCWSVADSSFTETCWCGVNRDTVVSAFTHVDIVLRSLAISNSYRFSNWLITWFLECKSICASGNEECIHTVAFWAGSNSFVQTVTAQSHCYIVQRELRVTATRNVARVTTTFWCVTNVTYNTTGKRTCTTGSSEVTYCHLPCKELVVEWWFETQWFGTIVVEPCFNQVTGLCVCVEHTIVITHQVIVGHWTRSCISGIWQTTVVVCAIRVIIGHTLRTCNRVGWVLSFIKCNLVVSTCVSSIWVKWDEVTAISAWCRCDSCKVPVISSCVGCTLHFYLTTILNNELLQVFCTVEVTFWFIKSLTNQWHICRTVVWVKTTVTCIKIILTALVEVWVERSVAGSKVSRSRESISAGIVRSHVIGICHGIGINSQAWEQKCW